MNVIFKYQNTSVVGYEISEPVPITLRLGKKSDDCPLFEGGYEHYEIEYIKKL